MSDFTLRSSLIRLAHSNPEFRKDILPMLKEAAPPPKKTFTFKDHPKVTGLARVMAGPRGADLKLDGKEIGSVIHSDFYADKQGRWSVTFRDPDGKLQQFTLKPTIDRDAAKAYLLKKATEAYSQPADKADKP